MTGIPTLLLIGIPFISSRYGPGLKWSQVIFFTLSQKAGHSKYKVYDFPTADQVKIYFDQASLHVYLAERWALYENIRRRPLFYQTNVLHRNSVHAWKWASDIFAILLITLNLTGVIILKGKYGITGRGKWFIIMGTHSTLMRADHSGYVIAEIYF